MPKPKHDFNEDEVKEIHSAALRVWQEIAGDCFEEGMPKSMPRSHVIELVCDASRLEQQIRRKNPALAARVEKTDYFKVLIPLLKPAFPHARYGR